MTPDDAWDRAAERGIQFCVLMMAALVLVTAAIAFWTRGPWLFTVWWVVFLVGNVGLVVRAAIQARRERALEALAGDDS